ncbi:hypothetical protein DFH09DRAFT_1339206 [Mycena vulgaris]|nr:hypothetical protein DFH09DRAFT_1339206 [Mycena vulgaris]
MSACAHRASPGSPRTARSTTRTDPERHQLARDVEGGACVYIINHKENYLCTPESRDIMHEIVDGKKIAHFIDFIDPDIVEKLEALEREKMLEAGGFYDSEEGMEEEEDERARIAHRPLAQDDESQCLEKRKRGSQMTAQRTRAGLDPAASDRAAVLSGKRKRDNAEAGEADAEGSMARTARPPSASRRLLPRWGCATKAYVLFCASVAHPL